MLNYVRFHQRSARTRVTDINQNKGRSVGNSDPHDPRFPKANRTPVFVPTAKPKRSRTQTKEVIEHLQQVQQQKKSGSALNNPAFLGAAMKAIYESSDVSVKRGDQTMVITQLKGDDPTVEMPKVQRLPTVNKQSPQTVRSAPHSATRDRFIRSDPFSSRPPIAPTQPASPPQLAQSKANVASEHGVPTKNSTSSYSRAEITFWILLALVVFSFAYWIYL